MDVGSNVFPVDQSSQVEEVVFSKKSRRVSLGLIALIGVFVIGLLLFFILVIFPSIGGGGKKISNSEIFAGKLIGLEKNSNVSFELESGEHNLIVENIGLDSVDLIIQSEPIRANIKIGETKKFDLEGDGFYDLSVELRSIKKGVPELFVKKIKEEVNVDGVSQKNVNKTNSVEDKISNVSLSVAENFTEMNVSNESVCVEDWTCGSWGNCFENGTQNRSCTDLNNCGSTFNKPALNQSCTYLPTSCMDFNNHTTNSTEVCCDDKILHPSLNSTIGVTQDYGCCSPGDCHETGVGGHGCVNEGVVFTGGLHHVGIEYYVICYNEEWQALDCSSEDLNCTLYNETITILNTSVNGFSNYLLGPV